jgi:hypothetical protein
MDRTRWGKTPDNINAGESARANVNRVGQNLSILAGVIRYCMYLLLILV